MRIKRIIDVSRRIHPGMTVWPGDEKVEIKKDSSIKNGDPSNLSHIRMSLHVGTHADVPAHFIEGAADTDSVNLAGYIGFVKVFELQVKKSITAGDIMHLPINEGDAVFFKTSNSERTLEEPFDSGYVFIDMCAGRYLVEKKIKAVGVDYLSVESPVSDDDSLHRLFLYNNIAVIEGLCLKDVSEGEYFYSCLPLRIKGGDGSPVRAVLLEFEY